MKKKLEAELISIAHRILKLKNKSDIVQLHIESQKLYEKLSVLRFVEENMSGLKPTIGRAETEALIEEAFEREPETTSAEPETQREPQAIEKEPEFTPVPEVIAELADEKEPEELIAEAETPEPEYKIQDEEPLENVVVAEEESEAETIDNTSDEAIAEEPAAEEITAEPVAEEPMLTEPEPIKKEEEFKPVFEWTFDPKTDELISPDTKQEPSKTEEPAAASPETTEAMAQAQIAFEDLLGPGYVDPVFVKSEDAGKEPHQGNDPAPAIPISRAGDKVQVIRMNNSEIGDRAVSLNDRLSKGITVGLNDRIAFVKHLFNNSAEDYNRVLSQLITFDTFEDAKEFIDQMVRPDYNNWEGRDEYAQRFLEIVEKKFT